MSYLPPPKDGEIMARDKVPWLLGTSSKRGGSEFSILAFSLSIVQEMLNIPVMLEKSGIPLGKRQRMTDETTPLVLLGGASALYTSLLFCDNPLVDGIFIGSDAETIERLFVACRQGIERGLTKRQLLDDLTKTPGFFEPDRTAVTAVFQNPIPPRSQLLETGPVLFDEEVIGSATLQISEGCPCLCGFCAEGFSHKPYREFDTRTLIGAARRMKAAMAAENVELYSFNFAMYRDFYPLLGELCAHFPFVGLKSQRMDSIAQDPELLGVLHAMGKSSLTCAIEGVSPRLRRYLHKSIDEATLGKSLSHLLQAPLREIKFFLIVTGLELHQDLAAFKNLLDHMQAILRGADRRPRIIFSSTILVRFPWTPLEFADAPPPAACEKIVRAIEQAVRGASFEFRTSASPSDYWISQIMVRAANASIAPALWRAQEETGFVYYNDFFRPFVDAVKRQLEPEGISAKEPLKAIAPDMRQTAPWAGIDIGIAPAFLQKQWEAAQAFVDEGYCLGSKRAGGACRECGACKDISTRRRLTDALPAVRRYSALQLKNRIAQAAASEKILFFRVRVGPLLRGIPRALRFAALARAMMLADDRLVDAFRRSAMSKTSGAFYSDWLFGEDVLALAWDSSCVETVRSLFSAHSFIDAVNGFLENRELLIGVCEPSDSDIGRIVMRSPFPFDPAGYCKNLSLKFTLRRDSDGSARYEFSKETLKKKIIITCSSKETAPGWVEVTVTPGPKFEVEHFARNAFTLPSSIDWVRIEMVAYRQ